MITPEYGRLVKSVKEFWELATGIVHVAFKRAGGAYFHHCIISSYFEEKLKVYEYFMAFKNLITGPGEVGNRDVNKTEIETAIKEDKLYVIEAPGYPKTKAEMKDACRRFWNRWNESLYSLATNNCEHLVNYILTGNPYSEQIRKIGAWGMAFIDSFDALISRGKRAMLKMGGCLLATIPARFFIQFAANEVINVAMQAPMASTTAGQVGRCAKNICNVASKTSSQFTKAELLASKQCAEAAKAAGKQALKRSAATTFVVGAAVEGGFAAYDIYQLNEQRKKGIISDRDFRRETTKTVGGAVFATGGSVAGGVIGQIICPIPVLGFAIGSGLGNIIGRAAGNSLFGFLFNKF